MSKQKKLSPDAGSVSQPPVHTTSRGRNIRETIESIAIAFILAFLFRTFEAEAFVIPTGSMAPTLQGRHKDANCPKCGYRTRANASLEEDEGIWPKKHNADRDVVAMTCPICRYNMSVDDEVLPSGQHKVVDPAYSGDRILVGKFAYEFGDPQRWDVVVFKFPGDAKMNYIKRLVGLPNEEVRIKHGDILVRPLNTDEPFQIARKPADKVLAMMQTVDDNRYIAKELVEKLWPPRWQPWPIGATTSWVGDLVQSESAPQSLQQTFSIDTTGDQLYWLRYMHLFPGPDDWREMENGPLPKSHKVKPRLITDFYAYNTSFYRADHFPGHDRADRIGLHWVGDLILQADVEVHRPGGELLLDLVEGGRHFTCRIDLTSGQAKMGGEGIENFQPEAQTPVNGPGTYQITFANVDDQLLLWVDGNLVEFESTDYTPPGDVLPKEADLAPAGIGAKGASLTVNGLRLLRDIYYIADKHTGNVERPISDFLHSPVDRLTTDRLLNFLSTPSHWDEFESRREADFPLQEDQFFMLGDNSPFSKDGRLWGKSADDFYVDRDLLIGKALFIYWPHSWNWPVPMFPNFKDMGIVK